MRNCPHRCIYCDQRAITGEYQPPSPQVVVAMLSTLLEPVELCYFGGSFTCLPERLQEEYLAAIVAAPSGSSVRFSTHPLCISRDTVERLKKFPISMVELGISSLDDHVLSLCNRGYSEKDGLNALKLLLDQGFSVAAQMMVGLPTQNLKSSLEDLFKLAELKGPRGMTLRFYPCLVLRNTMLENLLLSGQYTPLSVSEAAHWVGTLLHYAKNLGFSVQRVGLQQTESLERSVVAGPHHPSFGELAKSVAFVLRLTGINSKGPWIIFQKDVSLLTGHNCWGLSFLSEMTGQSPENLKAQIIIWENTN
nr:radical SAM protein [Aminobacterium sp. UBA4987]